MVDALFAGFDGCYGEEEEVASGYEGVWWCAIGLYGVHGDCGVGEGVAGETGDEGEVDALPFDACFSGYCFCSVNFGNVFLTVGVCESGDALEVSQGPIEAGGGILPAAEDDEGIVVVDDGFHVLICIIRGSKVTRLRYVCKDCGKFAGYEDRHH